MSAQAILAELETIRQDNGGLLNPADVVEFARNPETALHRKFTWDDGKAAEEYRLWQARQVIRVVVSVVGPDKEPFRVYASIQEDRNDKGGYRTLVSVMSDDYRRRALLSQAKADMIRFKLQYKRLVELAPVFAAMDPIIGDTMISELVSDDEG
jgi:hypothetical protein